jgi:excisionase family DNA binding protein
MNPENSLFAQVMAATEDLSDVSGPAGVTTRQLREWIDTGKLPAWKVGGKWRINPADLDKLVQPSAQAS